MHVRNAFSAIRTVIDDESIARFGNTQFSSQGRGGKQQMTKQSLIRCHGEVHPRNQFFRNHEHVNGCLRIDVVNRDTQIVLVGQLRRNLAIDNFLKQGLHGIKLKGGNGGKGEFMSWILAGLNEERRP